MYTRALYLKKQIESVKENKIYEENEKNFSYGDVACDDYGNAGDGIR